MTLLVTGAMGHVGLEIVQQAASQGIDVLALYRDGFREADAAVGGPRVKWLRCDLNDEEAVRGLAAKHPVDACIHAAAISNEAFARPNPLNAVTTNIGATASLLEAARVNNWRRFILVSTGSVFQHRADKASPILEDALPEPGNIYSTTKYSAELLTHMYRTEFGLSASTVRISWVFGPPIASLSPARGPIPSLLVRALRGIDIREGGGDFAASFTYIADAATGLLAASQAPQLRFPTYHLGHGVNFTARQAADAVRRAFPDAVIELRAGTEPWTKYTAIRGPLAGTRLLDDTGFVPQHTLNSAIAFYADWLRAHPETWRSLELPG